MLLSLFLTTGLFAQNSAPTFTSTAVTSVYADSLYSYTVETNDTDGDVVNVSGTTVPAWLSFYETYSDPVQSNDLLNMKQYVPNTFGKVPEENPASPIYFCCIIT